MTVKEIGPVIGARSPAPFSFWSDLPAKGRQARTARSVMESDAMVVAILEQLASSSHRFKLRAVILAPLDSVARQTVVIGDLIRHLVSCGFGWDAGFP